jgi:hypothetical protein
VNTKLWGLPFQSSLFANWYFLVGDLSPLTFIVNIERYVVILAISFFSCVSVSVCVTNSILFSDYLYVILLRFNNFHPFMTMFVFIF